jgi:predicted aspartyl protease
MRYWIVIAILATAAPCTSVARAADCNPLRVLTSVPMQPWTGRVLIPVEINGVAEKMLFDTGGGISAVAPHIVAQMNLAKRESVIALFGVDGSVSRSKVRLDSLQIGAMRGKDVNVMVSPGEDTDDASVAGSIAPDLMQRYDIELDFSAGKINYLSQDHCEGHVIYWPHAVVAMVPLTFGREGGITIPVTIDGHQFQATLDTGAANTIMNLRIAHFVFGLAPSSPGMKEAGLLGNNSDAKTYVHDFDTLSFDGVTVGHPHVVLLPDIVDKNDAPVTGSRLKSVSDDLGLPSIIIGMDILSKLHIYMAFKEQRLYVTPASAPVASAK